MTNNYKKPPFFALYSDEAFAAEVEVNGPLSDPIPILTES